MHIREEFKNNSDCLSSLQKEAFSIVYAHEGFNPDSEGVFYSEHLIKKEDDLRHELRVLLVPPALKVFLNKDNDLIEKEFETSEAAGDIAFSIAKIFFRKETDDEAYKTAEVIIMEETSNTVRILEENKEKLDVLCGKVVKAAASASKLKF